jgi:outer membrane receptor protein involved in Fe transport
MNKNIKLRFSTCFAAMLLPLGAIQAQDDDEVFELSPFSVAAGDNETYRPTSTLAGTRIKSNLRDVGSSVSVLTDEMFKDLGATDASTILSYATSAEVGGVNGNFGNPSFSGGRVNPSEQQRSPQNSQRVRGLAEAALTRGFFLTDIPFDNYNSDRMEINRGPNSLLFGIGKGGGVINNSVNLASTSTDFGDFSIRFGERGSHRETLDYNKVLVEDRLALRVSLLNEKIEYQQRPSYEEDTRFYAAFEGVLLKNEGSEAIGKTILRGNYEKGTIKGTPPSALPPAQGISTWFSLPDRSTYEAMTGTTLPDYFDDGSWSPKMIIDTSSGANFAQIGAPVGDFITIQLPLVYGTPDAQFPSAGLSDPAIAGTIGRVVWPSGDRFAARHDTIGSRSLEVDGLLPGFSSPTINNTNIFDNREMSIAGTLNFVDSDFEVHNLALEQTFFNGKAGLEIAFDSQTYNNFARLPFDMDTGSNNSALDLWVDMNTHLSNGEANPNTGRVAIRNRGTPRRTTVTSRDATRITLFTELDFANRDNFMKHAGRHVFTGLYNNQEIDYDSRNHQLTWTDASSATDVSDILFSSRSQGRILVPSIYYLTDPLTDPSIQSYGDVRIDQYITAPPPQVGDVYKMHYNYRPPVFDATSQGFEDEFMVEDTLWSGNHNLQDVSSMAASWQSFFLNGNVVGLLGWRQDKNENFEHIGSKTTMKLPDGELDPAGFALLSEPSKVPEWNDTLTKSIVAHLPQKLPGGTEVSFHFNQSENFEPVTTRRNARNDLIPDPTVTNKEYGITFEFLDRKLSARLNWYEMAAQYAKLEGVGGASGGVGTLVNISSGFYRRDADLANAITASDASGGRYNTFTEIYDAFEASAPSEVWDVYDVDYTVSEFPGFTNDGIDGLAITQSFLSEGLELEIAGAITPNWNVFMNVAKQETVTSDVGSVAFDLALEVAALAKATGIWDMTQSPSVGSEVRIGDNLTSNTLVPLAGAKTKEGTVSQEQRKWRWNITSTYKFDEGLLKGFGAGGALRWQDSIATGYQLSINSDGIQVPDLANPYYGSDELNGDVWVNYSRPLRDGAIDWKIQLNVRNLIGDQDMIEVVRNPDGRQAISRNPNPKEVFLTNTFSF